MKPRPPPYQSGAILVYVPRLVLTRTGPEARSFTKRQSPKISPQARVTDEPTILCVPEGYHAVARVQPVAREQAARLEGSVRPAPTQRSRDSADAVCGRHTDAGQSRGFSAGGRRPP